MFYKKKEKTKDKEYSMIGKTKSSLRFLRPVVGLGFFWVVIPVPADMSSAGNEYQDLDKIGCARQFESELSLHSLALFL